jgi:hypothetical protein
VLHFSSILPCLIVRKALGKTAERVPYAVSRENAMHRAAQHFRPFTDLQTSEEDHPFADESEPSDSIQLQLQRVHNSSILQIDQTPRERTKRLDAVMLTFQSPSTKYRAGMLRFDVGINLTLPSIPGGHHRRFICGAGISR